MKICIATGSRSEYGLLKNLIYEIKKIKHFKLKLIATGAHVSKKYNNTFSEIKNDGIKIDKKINLNINKDDARSIIKSINVGLSSFVNVYKNFKPDLVIVLGDRYEIFAAAIAASFSRILIAHIHGGEVTNASIDDSIRHSITKMSHFHFVAHEDYKKRIIQLGENPKRVFIVGGLGVDKIKLTKLLNKKEIEKKIGLKFNEKNLIVNFYPETLNKFSAKKHLKELLNSLSSLKKTNLIFTAPNPDLDSEIIFKMIKNYAKKRKNVFFYKSLGSLLFLSCLKYVDGMIGNSSSGLLEMPSFKKGTINIGERQTGRLKSISIIDVAPRKKNIIKAIKILYSKKFQKKLKKTKNLYGNGGSSKKIVHILKKINLKKVSNKKFYDIKNI